MTRMMPDFLVDASKGQKPQLVEKIHIQQEKTKPKEQQEKNIQIKIDNLADFVRTQKEKSAGDENWKNEAQRRLNHILEEITQPYFEDKDFLEIYECYKIIEMLTPVLEVGNEMRAMLLWGIVELEKKHFGSMGRMLDYISPEVIPADDFTSIVIDVAWRGEISEDFKTNLIQHLQYNVVYSSEYRDKLLENIDLTNSEEIFKTIAYLNFIKRVYNLKHYHTQKTEEAGIDIYNKLIDKKESAGEQIIYFLDLFLEELLQEMSGNEIHRDYDKFPFEVAQGIYGIHKNGVLYISQFEEHDKIKTQIASEQVILQAGNVSGNLQSHAMIDIPIGEILKEFSHLKPEEKEHEQFNYSFLMTKPIREKIGAEFDFELSDLSIKEQFYFLNYAKHYTVADIYKLKRFLNSTEDKTGRLNRIRSFLSMEQGGLEMGEKILLIGDRLDKDEVDLIFERYAKLVDLTENIREELKKQIKNNKIKVENIDDAVIKKIAQNVLLKANRLLIDFAGKLENGEILSGVDIERELEDYNDDLLFTFSVLKSLRGQLRLEDLEGVSFERVTVECYGDLKEDIDKIYKGQYTREDVENIEDLSKRERVGEVYDMFELYKKNYEDDKKLLAILLEEFRNILLNNDNATRFYLMKQNNRVVAFNRCDDIDKNTKYFASGNVLHSVQSLSVGRSLFESSLEAEKEDWVDIKMKTKSFLKIDAVYIEDGKFWVERIESQLDDLDVELFFLRRVNDKERNSYYENKNMQEEYLKQKLAVNNENTSERIIMKFDFDSKEQKRIIAKLVNEDGYKITRYMLNDTGDVVYIGLEIL